MSSLTDKQESCLRLYLERLEELLRSPIVTSKRKIVGTLCETTFGENPMTTVVFDGHSEDDYKLFYLIFRQFTMQSEKAVYFDNVCKIVLGNCNNADLKGWTNYANDRWTTLLDGKPSIQFDIAGESYTSKKLFRLWMYGGRFHTDIKKTKTWNGLPEMMRKDAELAMQALTPKLVNCLVTVGGVITKWLDEPNPIVPTPPPGF